MVKMIALVCPNCGAQLEIDEDRETCYCTYCGTQIMIQNENKHTIINKKIITDEARIKEAQIFGNIKEKEIEERKDNGAQKNKLSSMAIRFLIFMGIAGIIVILVSSSFDSLSSTLVFEVGMLLIILSVVGVIQILNPKNSKDK